MLVVSDLCILPFDQAFRHKCPCLLMKAEMKKKKCTNLQEHQVVSICGFFQIISEGDHSHSEEFSFVHGEGIRASEVVRCIRVFFIFIKVEDESFLFLAMLLFLLNKVKTSYLMTCKP